MPALFWHLRYSSLESSGSVKPVVKITEKKTLSCSHSLSAPGSLLQSAGMPACDGNTADNQREQNMESKPTFEQAQLHLQVYEERREPKLRQAREWFFQSYYANNFDEAMRLAAPGTETGAYYMMVVSYWEQACALLNYGLLHEDLFFETSGEFFGVWERIKPTIEEGRKRFSNNNFLAHIEKAARRYETWIEKRSPGHVAAMRQWMEQMRPKTRAA